MTPDRPQAFFWDGEVMKPRSPKLADQAYCVGEVYWLVPHEDRSSATHNHEFAWLKTAWLNLPESAAEQFPTVNHLRKRALIDAGFYDETIVDAGSNAAAVRVATAFRSIDEFALVVVRGPLVVRRTAKSQSRRAMDKTQFQDSKTALLETISNMIGISPEQLQSQFVAAAPPAAAKPAAVDRSPTLAAAGNKREGRSSFASRPSQREVA